MPYKLEWQERLGFPRSTLDHPVATDRHTTSEGASHTADQRQVLEGVPPPSDTLEGATNADAPESDDDDDWHSVAGSEATPNNPDDGDDDEDAEVGTPPARAPLLAPPAPPAPAPTGTRKSARAGAAPKRLIEERALTATTSDAFEFVDNFEYDAIEYRTQEQMSDPISFAATSDPDTMYLHEARREPDWPNFQAAMLEEVQAHENNGHWQMVHRDEIPEDRLRPGIPSSRC